MNDADYTKVKCKLLNNDWYWIKYDDGSGHLQGPNGKEYMSYDLQTNEYQITENNGYTFFPLDYYYEDGFKKSEFDPFEFMEQEMIDYVLPKERK